jgi:hypothetical protein
VYLVTHPPYRGGLSTLAISLLLAARGTSRTRDMLADEQTPALRKSLKPVAYALYVSAAICAVAGLVSLLAR